MNPGYRWVQRQSGAGAQRFLMEIRKTARVHGELNVTATALSEREAACAIVLDQADVAPGARPAATEAGLDFVPFGMEAFDFALPRTIWFQVRSAFRRALRVFGLTPRPSSILPN